MTRRADCDSRDRNHDISAAGANGNVKPGSRSAGLACSQVATTSGDRRLDEKLPVGFEAQDQGGFDGYKLVRYRKFYKDGNEVKTDKWTVTYKPVTQYLRKGTNPDTTLPTPTIKPGHLPRAPGEGSGRVVQ